MKKFFLLLLGVAVFIAAVGYFTGPAQKNQQSSLKEFVEKSLSSQTVKIGDLKINVEVADTASERRQGLSGKESLSANSGMLFIFEGKSKNPFWMKDMNFPIDMIWIDDGKIVGIEKNAQPQTGASDEQLRLYYPPVAVSQVLEVNAGFSDKNSIELGERVELSM